MERRVRRGFCGTVGEMEALKKKCMGQRIVVFVILAIIGVILIACTKLIAFRSLSTTELTADSDFEELEGKYVSYVMKAPLDYYETVGTRNSDTHVETINQYAYFVYDMDGKFFFGVMRDKSHYDEMEDMIDQLWDYWIDGTGSAPASVKVKGTLTKMDSLDTKYFEQLMEQYENSGITADAQYYYIEEGRYEGDKISTAWFMTLGGLALIVCGLIFWLYGSKSWDKKITKYLSKNSQYTRAQIEADVEGGKVMNGGSTIIGKRWLFAADSVVNFRELENLCWGYYYRRTGRNSVSQMRLFFADGSTFAVNASEGMTKEMLQYLYEQLPYVVVGYSKEWEKLYNKQREQFLSMRFYPGKQQAQAEGYTAEAEEETAYTSAAEQVDVELTDAGPNKIMVIKIIRETTGLGLVEAKQIAEETPSIVKSGVFRAEAEDIKAKLEAEGAVVTIKS